MQHQFECPNCAQHIIIDLPERGPVEVRFTFHEVFKATFFFIIVCGMFSLVGLLGFLILAALFSS